MQAVTENRSSFGLSGGTLKLLAVGTMLIDHIAAAVLTRLLYRSSWNEDLYRIYYLCRMIGRTAFPIYCFMLIEGVKYTHNRLKYLGRMGLLALLSEIPFDLAFQSRILEFSYQNVFFTLTIALAAMLVLRRVEEQNAAGGEMSLGRKVLQSLLFLVVCVVAMGMAGLMQTDYGWRGVFCILCMYFLRKNKILQLVAGYLAFVLLLGEVAALPAFLLLGIYNHQKGWDNKWFFYGFYPVHLFLLYLVCVVLKLTQYTAF